MKDNKIRKSNYELMRIISMLFIIMFHGLLHGKVFDNVSDSSLIFFRLLEAISLVHVNSFVLMCGYFQSESSFKISKLIKLNNQTWFYRAVIMIILVLLNIINATKLEIFKELFPIPITNYWFIGNYMLLYCVSPFLNKFIKILSKNDFRKLLVVLFIIISILPALTGEQFFNNNRGFSFTNFIFLYFIGAYLRKYPMNSNFIFKNFSFSAKRTIYIAIVLFLAIFNMSIFFLSGNFGDNQLLKELGNYVRLSYEAYDNPIVIFQSIFYFCIFGTIKFKNKFINKIGSLTFAVYLFHDHTWIQPFIFKWFGLRKMTYSFSDTIIKLFVSTALIFIVAIILESIRQIIFKFIYNRKISKKFRNYYRNKIDSLGYELSWE